LRSYVRISYNIGGSNGLLADAVSQAGPKPITLWVSWEPSWLDKG